MSVSTRTVSLGLALCAAAGALHAEGPAAQQTGEAFTLARAEALLAERGFDYLVAQAGALGAEGDLIAQSASANPTLSAGLLDSLRVSDPDPQKPPLFDSARGYSVGLSDNAALFDLLTGKKGLRREVAQAALAAARASRDDALRTLTFQLRQAWVAALLARDNLRFAREVQASYADTLRLMQLRFQQGAIGPADVAKVATAEGEAEQAVEQAIGALAQARGALLVFLGERPGLLLPEPLGELWFKPEAAPDLSPAELSAQAAFAKAHRPDLQAAIAAREQGEQALVLARRLRVPDITLSASYNTQVNLTGNPATVVTPPDFSFGVSLPVPIFDQQQGQVQRAEMNLRIARAQEGKALAQVNVDLLGAAAALRAARQQTERMERALLGHARTARDVEKVLYEKGGASLLDYLDAQRTFVATTVEHHQDLAAFWTALASLRAAVGDPSPLPLPEAP